MGFQNTQIIGYVGKDPETRHVGDGKQVCSFSVAVSEKWKDENGDKKDSTTWYKVSAWGAKADVCQQWVKKGMQIMVQGKVSAGAWIDKEGEVQSSLELTARDFQFLGLTARDFQFLGGKDGNQSQSNNKQSDDDLPF